MILVEVYIPAADETFDFELDENVKIKQIVNELCGMLRKKISGSLSENSEEFILCSMDKKKILPEERTLTQCRIRDGSKLLLV